MGIVPLERLGGGLDAVHNSPQGDLFGIRLCA